MYIYKSQWFSLCKEWRGVETGFFSFFFKPLEKLKWSGWGSPYDPDRKEEHQPWMLHPSRKENLWPPRRARESVSGSQERQPVSGNGSDPSCKKKHTCHEFYLNNTGVHHGRAKRVSTENECRHSNLEGMVPEYFLSDYQGECVAVTTRGQQEQARYENMMLGGSIAHHSTSTKTQTDRHTDSNILFKTTVQSHPLKLNWLVRIR